MMVYGSGLAFLLFVMRWLELRLIIINHAIEIYAGVIAVVFTALGVWLTIKLTGGKPRVVVVEKPVPPVKTNDGPFRPDPEWLKKTGLSERELEVLSLMAEGCSNQEIAARLYLSTNTIKTHSSRLFEKLEVNRRTQAVEKGRRMGIIP